MIEGLETARDLAQVAEPTVDELSLPAEARDGVSLLAGLHPWAFFHRERLSLMLTYSTENTAPLTAAESAAMEAVAEVNVAVDDALATTPEYAIEREACARHDAAKSELEKAKAAAFAARSEYDMLVTCGEDPRGARPAMTAANEELEDVSKFLSTRYFTWQATLRALQARRSVLYRELAVARRAEVRERKLALKAKAEAAAIELGFELLAVDALEKAYSK